MKKLLISVLVVALVVGLIVYIVGRREAVEEPEVEKIKVVLYINGTLGDKSFFDSANRGLQQAITELGIEGKTIEGGGVDAARWESDLDELSRGDWDLIIVGTWQMVEILERIAPKYPNQKYVIFDTAVDYTKGNLSNVYSILYKQNEGSFLVGALAALITTSDMPQANKEKVVGFLGGMDIPVINDFKVGYEQGVRYIDPAIRVLVSYAGTFIDPAKGKELMLAQYDQGADIAFNVAGLTGLGLLEAAKERKKYAIGVDSDQYLMIKDTDPEKASFILVSMMKNVDVSLFRAIQLFKEGKLEFGRSEAIGLREGGVGVSNNYYYQQVVPEAFRNKIAELEQKIIKGEIVVESAFVLP
ncbi:MAG: Membrane lipoprotein TmpC [candidate division WS2 bacterium]|uniref:Membrane lipoprotein TmpC n=1 Tax=Psychracetigena formicireducens TaxID=2986056 RepID=A0A9E2F167_PSYF1|nr:Membrane lipoprotein TmpC [Candidatus Psychracetigena formicireducens]MBT9144432.1 Membrane lipoprotein TmpC [Candidatus Psychracetigena formicireducens]